MINIEIGKEPLRVVCSGHADGAGEYGENLVCCAVSALVYTLCEAAEELDLDFSCEEADGYMEVTFGPDEENRAALMVAAASAGLRSLARQHPGQIDIFAEQIFAGKEER